MPRTRGESIFFTVITAWMMVYVMTLYNTVLAMGSFIIFTIQTFTVIWQVAFASILGVYHGYGFTGNFIPDYLMTYCRNFVMVFPLQLIIVGPLARLIFRKIYMKRTKVKCTNEIQNEDEQIVEKTM